MANFCGKCGAPLPPETSFCSICGTPASAPASSATAEASSAPAYQVPAYQAPGTYGQPAPVVPTPSGGSGLKIVLIIVGVLIALALLAVLAFSVGIWRISRAVHTSRNGVTLSTPGGTFTAGNSVTASAADLGVEPYPGAVRQQGGVQIKSANGSMITAIYSTSDPVNKVIDFYKDQLGQSASVMQTRNGAILTAGDHDKESTMVTVTTDSSDQGNTKIMVMHTKK